MNKELLKLLDEKILDEKFENLQKNIENYCSLESRLEETLWLILDILKDLRNGDKE